MTILPWTTATLFAPLEPIPPDYDVDKLIADLTHTMVATGVVGIAANQVGVPYRVCLLATAYPTVPAAIIALINPEILGYAGTLDLEAEGCASFPDQWLTTLRHREVYVRSVGRGREWFGPGRARIAQHEIDHLDGITFHERARRVTYTHLSLEGS